MSQQLVNYKKTIGKTYQVLVEKPSKKNPDEYSGRNSQNTVCIFPKGNAKVGEYVNVKITNCTAATLRGEIAE